MTVIDKHTAAEYCHRNVLVLPKALFAMSDVQVLMHSNNAAICYKQLEQNLVDVEFYSQVPCLVYIVSGEETITCSGNQQFQFGEGDLFLLPRGEHLHSDFVRSTRSLSAYLLFFDDSILGQFYVDNGSLVSQSADDSFPLVSLVADKGLKSYFQSLSAICQASLNSRDLIRLKLLEALHLVALQTPKEVLQSILTRSFDKSAPRNIRRLMEKCALSAFTVQDLANLSGRSLSAFSREFKVLYDTSPKQWLTSQRLTFAQSQLVNPGYVSSITVLASELGYQNTSHFIQAFKNRYGVTPKQYRLTAQETA